ncbi:MAG: replicative DNA helicase [SAR324 cluster bacterium]|nr:replicative DNA helicase [SAR324 cluster bacterium]
MSVVSHPTETLLPHDKEAEQAVLGAIIHDNEALHAATELLQPEAFFSPAHRNLFAAMMELAERTEPIDEITLGHHLRAKNQLDSTGGLVYIGELFDLTPVASNVRYYAEIVREKSQLRSLIDSAMDIASKGRDAPEDVGGLIQQAEDIFLNLATDAAPRSYVALKEILTGTFTKLEEAHDRPGGMMGVPMGFIELDELTNGLQPSNLIIVAARPSMGKTSFATNVAKHAAVATGQPSLVFSLEMSKEELAMRLLCTEAKVDSQKFRANQIDEYEWDKLAAAAGVLSEAKIFIDESPELNPLAMKAIARRVKAEHGLGLIVVDYLQLMRAGRRTDNREQEIADISRGLKAAAKDLGVPLIACAQLNRALEARTNKRPQLSDLRESGSIEQEADLVMFIYRDEYYNNDTEDQGIAEISIAKHRNGPIGMRRLAFTPTFTHFGNLSLRTNDDGPPPGGPPSLTVV